MVIKMRKLLIRVAIQQLKAKDTIISKMRKEKEKLENERNALEIKVTEETQRLMEIVNKLQQSLETQAKSYEEKLAEKEQVKHIKMIYRL